MKVEKKEWFYIPNLLTYLRIILIPVIMVLYLTRHDLAALICLLVSELSDVLDGWLARKLNQVSELGILLDPVADKFTQGMIVICLGIRYPILWILFAVEVVKEVFMIVAGTVTISRCHRKLGGAGWYGKVSTFVTDATLCAYLLLPDMSDSVRLILMIICGAFMLLALGGYFHAYWRIWHGDYTGTIEADRL